MEEGGVSVIQEAGTSCGRGKVCFQSSSHALLTMIVFCKAPAVQHPSVKNQQLFFHTKLFGCMCASAE